MFPLFPSLLSLPVFVYFLFISLQTSISSCLLEWNQDTHCVLWSLLSVSCFTCRHTQKYAATESHCSTLSVLHSCLRGWDEKREIQGGGGGAKSSIIYGWNLIRSRGLARHVDGSAELRYAAMSPKRHYQENNKLKHEQMNVIFCIWLNLVLCMCNIS